MKTSLSLFVNVIGLIICSALGRDIPVANSELERTDMAETTLEKDNDSERAFDKIKPGDNSVGIGDVLKTGPAAIAILININYKQDDTMQTVKEVGNAIVPFIAAGLALIPGVGPIIGGIFAGVWGLLSPFLGGEGKSPVEKLQEKLTQDVEALNRKIDNLRKDITDQLKKEREQTRIETQKALGQLVADKVHGEMVRNNYICQKYSFVSVQVANALWRKQNINQTVELEMKTKMENCDNFLKDTSMAFIAHQKYADVLWAASTFTTLIRVAFLTEAANYGPKVGVSEELIQLYKNQIKEDLKKHRNFFNKGISERAETFADPKLAADFTVYEYEACRMQSRLAYFDRDRYPYGVPEYTTVSMNTFNLDLTQLFDLNDKPEKHIQIFFDDKEYANGNLNIPRVLNCNMMGPLWITPFRQIDKTLSFKVNVIFLVGKMYELRLLSLSLTSLKRFRKEEFDLENYRNGVYGLDEGEDIITFDDKSNGNNKNINLKVRYSLSTENPKGKRYAYDSVYIGGKCTSDVDSKESCIPSLEENGGGIMAGIFSIDTVGNFDFTKSADGLSKVMAIVRINLNSDHPIFFFGFEVIMTS